jgi:dTDP-4-amino-4,6-dideoxygalactose transaminase
MNVPFSNLKARHQKNFEKFTGAFLNSLNNSEFILGSKAQEFEVKFSKFVDSTFASGVGNGSDAIRIAIAVKNLPRNSEIILACNTYFAAAAAVAHSGLIPQFFDVEIGTRFPGLEQIEKARTNNTVGIIRSHLFGSADTVQVEDLVEIHDCSQAHGTLVDGDHVGKGFLSTFSLYPGKNLGAFGDAGVITTDSREEYEMINSYRNQGTSKDRYKHDVLGFNSRLDSIQAAVLLIKLEELIQENSRRQEIADLYEKNFTDSAEKIALFTHPSNVANTNHLFQVYLKHTDLPQVQQVLLKAGIETGRHYPIPLHLQPAFQYLGYARGDFPNAEDLASKTLSLPNYPEMTNSEVDYVSEELLKALSV